jgi:hypothetical protein
MLMIDEEFTTSQQFYSVLLEYLQQQYGSTYANVTTTTGVHVS